MAIIKPISDLRNKSNEISSLARESQEPIYITKNGEGDMVVLSIEEFRRRELRLDLYARLAVGQAQIDSGEKGRSYRDVITEARKKLNAEKDRG